MKHSDRHLRRLDDRYFNSRLADRLQKRRARRIVFILSVLGLIAFGFLVGFTVWSFIAPNPTSPLEKLLSALFWVAIVFVIQIEPLLVMSIRSAIAWPGQPYDERQEQLNMKARSEVRPFVLAMLGIAILTGLGMLIAMSAGFLPFSHPIYGGIPIYSGMGMILFALAKNAPYLLLAWQLPDEPSDDSDLGDDG